MGTNCILIEFERMFPSGLDALVMPKPTHPVILRPKINLCGHLKLVGNF
jgi:hypothetical protein